MSQTVTMIEYTFVSANPAATVLSCALQTAGAKGGNDRLTRLRLR